MPSQSVPENGSILPVCKLRGDDNAKRENISNLLVRLKFSALMALDGITSNLLRTFLTVLGISIGVARNLANGYRRRSTKGL